jgi:hypothetical protein
MITIEKGTKGIIKIPALGRPEFVALTGKPSLKQMQDMVGGLVQRVSVRVDGRTRDMIVNEEGLILGLPFNIEASKLWAESYQQGGGMIVGDAIVLIGWRL